MSGVTIIGLQPTDIVPYRASMPYDQIRTYQIGKYVIRIGIHFSSIGYDIGTCIDSDWKPIHMEGLIGWDAYYNGDHIGSPYWSLNSSIYGLARIWDDLYPGMVRWDLPNMGKWNHDIINQLEGERDNALS